jgi:anti-anti-sigma regulatory factor
MVTILEEISDIRTNTVILDLTGMVPDIDISDPLVNITRYSKLLGATCIITGINQKTVRRISDLGVKLTPVTTERSLEEGLRYTIAVIVEENDNEG